MASGLIVIDMLNPYQHEDAEPLKDSVREMLENLSALIEAARGEGLRLLYVNDNQGDWTAGPREIARRALAGAAPELVEPVLPPDDAPFIVKARHSIFYQTLLEYLLQREGIDRLVLAGQVTEQCILYSALDGYVRHFEVVVPTDAVAHIDGRLGKAALEMMQSNMHARLAEGPEAVLEACRA
jgi:nicotinamidase-related amidase